MSAPTRASGLTAGVVAALTDGSGNTTFTLNTKPATTNDSIMVAVFGVRSGTVTVTGGGGTWAQESSYNDTGDLALASIWVKQATTTDVSGATYTITTSQASTHIEYAVEVITGGTFDVVAAATMKSTNVSSGTSFALAAAALAPNTANDLFYGFVGTEYATTSAVTFSVPTNYTLAQSKADASTDGSLYLWYRAKSSDSTSENPSTTPTYTGSINSIFMSALLAFKPTTVGPIASSPSSVSFSTATTTISVTDPNNSGTVTVTSNNTGIVTVSPASFTGAGPQTVTITGVAAGSTTITLADTNSNTTTVNVTYAPTGPLTLSPTMLSFAGATAPAQTFTASESGYSGPFTASSSNTGIATVSGSGSGPGPITFTVSPVALGSATITVTDNHGGSQTVAVTVTSSGPISVSGTGSFSGNATTLTLTDPGNAGTITATVNDPTIASVSPSSATGAGPLSFIVTGLATGTTYITFSDGSNTKVETISYTAGSGGSITSSPIGGALTAVPPPPRILLTTQSPPQVPPQSVEIALDKYGGDFIIAPNGDLQLVYDTFDSAAATQQRLERMLMTSPTLRDVDGVAIGRADDIFNPDYGAGLPAMVGEPNTAVLVNAARSRILAALAADPEITQSPPPVVTIVTVDAVTVQYAVVCYTVVGQSVTLPPTMLQVTGG